MAKLAGALLVMEATVQLSLTVGVPSTTPVEGQGRRAGVEGRSGVGGVVLDGPGDVIGADGKAGRSVVGDGGHGAVVIDGGCSEHHAGGGALAGVGIDRDQGRAGDGRELRVIDNDGLEAGSGVAGVVLDGPGDVIGADGKAGRS